MFESIIGFMFLVNAHGELVSPVAIAAFENRLACESNVSEMQSKFKEKAATNPQFTGIKAVGVCVDGADIN